MMIAGTKIAHWTVAALDGRRVICRCRCGNTRIVSIAAPPERAAVMRAEGRRGRRHLESSLEFLDGGHVLEFVCRKNTGPTHGEIMHSHADPIEAELVGSNECRARDRRGITVRSSSPILGLCRALVGAGYDPGRPLHVYRGNNTLALTVRSIGEGARLRVVSSGIGFCWDGGED